MGWKGEAEGNSLGVQKIEVLACTWAEQGGRIERRDRRKDFFAMLCMSISSLRTLFMLLFGLFGLILLGAGKIFRQHKRMDCLCPAGIETFGKKLHPRGRPGEKLYLPTHILKIAFLSSFSLVLFLLAHSRGLVRVRLKYIGTMDKEQRKISGSNQSEKLSTYLCSAFPRDGILGMASFVVLIGGVW